MNVSTVTPHDLYVTMRRAYDDLIDFVTTPGFQALYLELRALPYQDRIDFVEHVVLNQERLKDRGIAVPDEIFIQRSSFGDRRPTLFCVKKLLPLTHSSVWQNVNITFDNDFLDSHIPRGEKAWRRPLPVDVQAVLMKSGLTAEELGVP